MMRWFMAVVVLVVGVATAGAGEEVLVDGVRHVRNPARPPEGLQTLELEELWRVGGADDEETIFGAIVHALSDEQGNVYLLDMQLSQMTVYSPTGERLRQVSREGEGPGESRNPSDAVWLPDGTLGLLQTFPGKLIKLTRSDEPAGSITFSSGSDATQGGIFVAVDAECRGGNLVLAGMNVIPGDPPSQQTRRSFLAAFGEDGIEKVRYWEKSHFMDLANLKVNEHDQYNLFPRRWDLSDEGEVYAATDRDRFEVSVFAADGKVKMVIEKEFTNRKRTPEETALYRRIADAQLAQLPGEPQVTIAETPEAIQSVEVAPDGSVWVLTSLGAHEPPAGTMAVYDLFDGGGHYLRQVAVACDGDGQNDGLMRIGRDRMLLIRGLVPAVMAMQGAGGTQGDEEPAPMEVVCYRIKE